MCKNNCAAFWRKTINVLEAPATQDIPVDIPEGYWLQYITIADGLAATAVVKFELKGEANLSALTLIAGKADDIMSYAPSRRVNDNTGGLISGSAVPIRVFGGMNIDIANQGSGGAGTIVITASEARPF